MNILITGCSGLVGSYLAAEFSSLGTLYGIRRAASSARLPDSMGLVIQWIEADLMDQEQLEEALADMDLVIHAAGMVSFESSDRNLLFETNVIGTRNLVNAMLESGTKKLIFISSVAALGRPTDTASLDETFKWAESPYTTDYARSKYQAELEVWRAQEEGLQVLIINPSLVLAKVDDRRSSTSIYAWVLEEKNHYPSGRVNFIDVRDVATLTRTLYQGEKWGERFILSAGSISYQAFFEEMAKAFDKKPPTKAISSLGLKLAVWAAGIARWLRLSSVPLNRNTALISRQKLHYSHAKVVKETGFEFRQLAETFLWAK